MCLNLQNNLSNVSYFNYLSGCDLINKYNLTSVHHIPKLDNINLELNLKDLLGSYEIVGKDQTDPIIQTKAFICTYLI